MLESTLPAAVLVRANRSYNGATVGELGASVGLVAYVVRGLSSAGVDGARSFFPKIPIFTAR